MNAGASHPRLRLVGLEVTDEMANWQRRQQAKNDVVKENRLSAHGSLTPDDPALKLAAQVRNQLQGPVLSPERRERVLKIANKLGMRPFEASLIIAIEQDRARTPGPGTAPAPGTSSGKSAPALAPLSAAPSPESIAARTAHITEHIGTEAPMMAARWLLAAASAVLLAAILIRLIA
jgi:hypothetical protein